VKTASVAHEDDAPDARPRVRVVAAALLPLYGAPARRAFAAVAAAPPEVMELAAALANVKDHRFDISVAAASAVSLRSVATRGKRLALVPVVRRAFGYPPSIH
jgi:hypothetical protein